jgi:hypothetical protein
MKVFSNSSVCRVPLIVSGLACLGLSLTLVCRRGRVPAAAPRHRHTGMQHDNVHLQIPSTSPQPVFEDSIVARP